MGNSLLGRTALTNWFQRSADLHKLSKRVTPICSSSCRLVDESPSFPGRLSTRDSSAAVPVAEAGAGEVQCWELELVLARWKVIAAVRRRGDHVFLVQ
jgi:hypothetical protein